MIILSEHEYYIYAFVGIVKKIGHETEEWDEERVRNDENKRTNKERKERARLYKKYFGTWKE